jgi:pimeloyl-ACP methyl ester carboxylesterase
VAKKIESVWVGPKTDTSIVMLHEGLGSVSAWRDFPALVSQTTGLGVFVYSRLGYGRSDPVPLPRPLRYMHDEAALLPDILKDIPKPILLGHSDGASIAIIAAGSGFETRGLVLLAPHVFCEDRSIDGIEKARDAYEHGDLRARLAKHHEHVDVAFWGWNRAWLDPGFRAWNIEEYLPRITAPVLVVQGDADPYGTLAQVDAIERGVPGGITKVILPDTGHAPHRERPAETLDAIRAFVSR